ncbi:MAG: hypothetical protein B7Z61_00125 [Acidobacteria bacterium 37-71-11]|nr:MAG: hypothetical protein B7Z61_00125 [Acidobacteria bacterium 37-71-11]
MTINRNFAVLGLAVLVVAGCNMQDTTTPVPQPDSLILGRIAAIREAADKGVWELEINEGLPETMQAAMRREGKPVPKLDKDVKVRIRVTADTVCVAGERASGLDDFRVGQEVAVNPMPGTTAMVGTKLLLADAAEVYLFSVYQMRFLPRSLQAIPADAFTPDDPKLVNSAGLEMTPLPAAEGKAVYFAAGLLPGVPTSGKDAPPVGAVRPGMRDAKGALAPWAVGGYRPYRTAWENGAWTEPQPVEFPGLAPDVNARLTWIDGGETACLVEVMQPSGGVRGLYSSQRAGTKAPWAALVKVDVPGGPSVGDAQRFGRQLKALVWTVYDQGSSDLWLSTEGKPGQPLEPRINTMGPEYAPRVGANNRLYFCRADRQLLFAGGVVQEVRLPGAQRRPLLEAVPSADGKLLFFRVPRYAVGATDWDLAVAPLAGTNVGEPVLLDKWKPE